MEKNVCGRFLKIVRQNQKWEVLYNVESFYKWQRFLDNKSFVLKKKTSFRYQSFTLKRLLEIIFL